MICMQLNAFTFLNLGPAHIGPIGYTAMKEPPLPQIRLVTSHLSIIIMIYYSLATYLYLYMYIYSSLLLVHKFGHVEVSLSGVYSIYCSSHRPI